MSREYEAAEARIARIRANTQNNLANGMDPVYCHRGEAAWLIEEVRNLASRLDAAHRRIDRLTPMSIHEPELDHPSPDTDAITFAVDESPAPPDDDPIDFGELAERHAEEMHTLGLKMW